MFIFDLTFTSSSNSYRGDTLKHDVNWPENNTALSSIIIFASSFIDSLIP